MKRCLWTVAGLIAATLLAPGSLRGESGPASSPDAVGGQTATSRRPTRATSSNEPNA